MSLNANLNYLKALAIGQSIHSLNNGLVNRNGTINAIQKVKSFFLVGNEDFLLAIANQIATF